MSDFSKDKLDVFESLRFLFVFSRAEHGKLLFLHCEATERERQRGAKVVVLSFSGEKPQAEMAKRELSSTLKNLKVKQKIQTCFYSLYQ